MTYFAYVYSMLYATSFILFPPLFFSSEALFGTTSMKHDLAVIAAISVQIVMHAHACSPCVCTFKHTSPKNNTPLVSTEVLIA